MALPLVVWLAAIISLLSGLIQVLCLKWQNRQQTARCSDELNPECSPEHFTQAFLQTVAMFTGECLCLLVYYIQRSYRKKTFSRLRSEREIEDEFDETKTEELRVCPWWWWITPAPLDFVESLLSNMATAITYASTVQMLHNAMVIASAVFQIFIIRQPLKLHEWLGCIVVTAALVLTGIPALTDPEEATARHSSTHWIGIVLAISSTCIHALQNIWEEKLFEKGKMDPVLAVGIEGAAGLVFSFMCLPIIHILNIEDVSTGIYQLSVSFRLRLAAYTYSLVSCVNNVFGLVVTMYSSALLRCLFMSMRPPLIWITEMGLGWKRFDWFNFFGMVILGLGLSVHLLLPPWSKYSSVLNKVVSLYGLRADTDHKSARSIADDDTDNSDPDSRPWEKDSPFLVEMVDIPEPV